MLMKKNYHTHTYRCGHAYGKDADYINAAIDVGLTHLGFSDHIILKNHTQKGIRGDYILFDDYVESINNLKQLYKDKINIKLGFEAEYFSIYEDYYRDLLDKGIIDYLILGQHCYINEKTDEIVFYNSSHHSVETINKYKDDLINGMRSGLYSYVAHPDHYMSGYGKWDEHAINVAHEICKAAVKYNLPLEINLAGVRHFRNRGGVIPSGYPYDPFWEIVKLYPIKVVIGLDCHHPDEFYNTGINVALDIIKYNDLDVTEDIKMYKEIKDENIIG